MAEGYINLVGKLDDPLDSTPDKGGRVKFTMLSKASVNSLKSSNHTLVIDTTGDYNIELPYGDIMIEYITTSEGDDWVELGQVRVNSQTTAKTIPELVEMNLDGVVEVPEFLNGTNETFCIRLVGRLDDPLDKTPDVGSKVRFTMLSNTGNSLRTATQTLEVDPSGEYDITLTYGNIHVEYMTALYLDEWVDLGTVVVNHDTKAETIPQLLATTIPPTDEALVLLHGILSECNDARRGAEAAEDNAKASEEAALVSELNAKASEEAALVSELNAKASEEATLVSELNAKASADDSAQSAADSLISATNSEMSAIRAENAFDSYDDRYLGSKSDFPTTDNDGDPLMVGSTFWHNVEETLYYWDGVEWESPDKAASASAQASANSAQSAANSANTASQQASAAANSASAAKTAQSKAETAQNKAELAQSRSETAQNKAENARDASISAKNDSVLAKESAEVAKNQAISAKNEATIQANNAKDSADDAETAKNQAIAAKNEATIQANNAKDSADDARDEFDTAKATYVPKSSVSDSVTSSSTTNVSSSKATKIAYDLAAAALPKSWVSSSTSSSSSSNAASSSAVKAAMDKANSAKSIADSKSPLGHTHDDRYFTESEANSKYVAKSSISSSTSSTSTTNVANSKAVKSAYDLAASKASSSHTHTKAEVGLSNVNNWPATGSVSDTSDTKYATAGAVQQTYARAETKVAKSNVSNSTTSNSTSTVASSSAVKAAMDRANAAYDKAEAISGTPAQPAGAKGSYYFNNPAMTYYSYLDGFISRASAGGRFLSVCDGTSTTQHPYSAYVPTTTETPEGSVEVRVGILAKSNYPLRFDRNISDRLLAPYSVRYLAM